MFNVDTISCVVNFLKYDEDRLGFKKIDTDKVNSIDFKIKSKLYYDEENQQKLKSGRKDVGMRGKYNGYAFYYNCEWYSLTIIAPHFKIESFTGDEILTDIKDTVMGYFNITEDEMTPIYLIRYDIKNDFLCKPVEGLTIIKNIMYKTREKFRFYRKYIEQDDNRGFVVKYKSKKKNKYGEEYFKTKHTFKSYDLHVKSITTSDKKKIDEDTDENGNYIQYAFYDKEKETVLKVARGKADKSDIDKYKNVFRSEIRIMNGRLNSNKFENNTLSKELSTYYNAEMTNDLYDKYIKDVLGVNDFYRIDVAVEIVRNSKYKLKKRQALEELLKLVNRVGYTSAEKIWIEKYSRSTFYNHQQAIEELELNIITFDVEINGEKIKSTRIPNFGQRKNGIAENNSN